MQIKKPFNIILSELLTDGLSLTVTGKSSLRIRGEASRAQIDFCRQFKHQIIEALSPRCSNCLLPMELIDDGKRWFCSLGCPRSIGDSL